MAKRSCICAENWGELENLGLIGSTAIAAKVFIKVAVSQATTLAAPAPELSNCRIARDRLFATKVVWSSGLPKASGSIGNFPSSPDISRSHQPIQTGSIATPVKAVAFVADLNFPFFE